MTRDDYDDGLEITAVEPVVAYDRSTPAGAFLDPPRLDRLRETVADRTAHTDAFRVTKAVGVFTCLAGEGCSV